MKNNLVKMGLSGYLFKVTAFKKKVLLCERKRHTAALHSHSEGEDTSVLANGVLLSWQWGSPVLPCTYPPLCRTWDRTLDRTIGRTRGYLPKKDLGSEARGIPFPQ